MANGRLPVLIEEIAAGQFERKAETECFAQLDFLNRPDDSLWCEQIEPSTLIVGAEISPR